MKHRYSLSETHPAIAAQWDFERNAQLSPDMVTASSNKKIWFKCRHDKVWKASILHRTYRYTGRDCPCQSHGRTQLNNLSISHPELCREWSENNMLFPEDVTGGSHKRILWYCLTCGYRWSSPVSSRTRGSGCPACAGKVATSNNSLAKQYPEICDEWGSDNLFNPSQFTPGSKQYVKWKCNKCEHTWYTAIQMRTIYGQGCPACTGRVATQENNLQERYPEHAKLFDSEKNNGANPLFIMPKSNKPYYWKCPKCYEEWLLSVNMMTKRKFPCSYCAGRKASSVQNLATVYPDIAREFDIEKNNICPEQISYKDRKRYHWKCAYDHSWQATVIDRTFGGNGCPYCKPHWSLTELRILCELRAVLPNVQHQQKIENESCDMFIDAFSLIIEYDSFYYHEKKNDCDISKTEKLLEAGYTVIRIREQGLCCITDADICISSNCSFDDMCLVLNNIRKQCSLSFKVEKNIDHYLSADFFQNDEEFKKLASCTNYVKEDRSLAKIYPQIASLWHEDNLPLKPHMVSYGSGLKVKWKCTNNHSWEECINVQTRFSGCQYCLKRRPSSEYNLATEFPKIANDWNSDNQYPATSYLPSSGKQVNWRCHKCKHEWSAKISNRTSGSQKCPCCKS